MCSWLSSTSYGGFLRLLHTVEKEYALRRHAPAQAVLTMHNVGLPAESNLKEAQKAGGAGAIILWRGNSLFFGIV